MDAEHVRTEVEQALEFMDAQCIDADEIIERYSESHRFYHDLSHLEQMLKQSESRAHKLASVFHDVVYDPKCDDRENVAESIRTFEQNENLDSETMREEVIEMIGQTADHGPDAHCPDCREFVRMDARILLDGSIQELIRYENRIRKEFQFVEYGKYVEGRLGFLDDWIQRWEGENEENVEFLKKYVRSRDRHIAYYPGSFDPLHKGHRNVLNRAKKLFDEVVLLVGQNLQKGHSDEEQKERFERVNESAEYTRVEMMKGWLHEYVPEGSVIIKGLRDFQDFRHEKRKLRIMEDIANKNIDICYMLADRDSEHVSSSMVRKLNSVNEEMGSQFTE